MKRSSSYYHETKKIRKLLNEEVKLGIHPSSDSETEDVDFHKELHPLSHYMNNKEEMIEQMFSIIKGDKLMKMLPPILKDMPLDELKADCLIHLLGMSKKRITAILEGKEINSSSDSESHSDSSSPRRKTKPIVKPIVIKQEGCSDISDNSEEVILIDPDRELFDSLTKSAKDSAEGSSKARKKLSQHKNKLLARRTKTISGEQESDIQVSPSKSEDPLESSSDNANSNEDEVPKEGKTLLEILELEMRARAIRALLHKSDAPEEEEEEKGINLQEKSNPDRNISDEADKNKITQNKKSRRKKRKNDDVIVITPKVVTIDLTDENDVSNAKKKQSVSHKNNKSENINLKKSQSKDDSHKKTEPTIKETDANKNECINLIDVDSDCTEINKKKEHSVTSEPDVTSESSTQNTEQSSQENLQKTEVQKSNWAQRWLESKEVKKVVSTSKICGIIRKRIKNAKLAKQNRDNRQVESQEICGSVDEYQLLSRSSKASDPSVNPVEVCNSENSLISNEGASEKQTDKESKDTSSSVEQVQDVSSTKNETPTDGKCVQENIIDESSQENILDECNQENIIVDSNSEVFNHDSSHSNLESYNVHTLNIKQNTSQSRDFDSATSKVGNLNSNFIGEINLNNPDSHGLDDATETSKPLLDTTVEFQNNQSEQDSTKSKDKHLVWPTTNDLLPDSYQSSEQIQLSDLSVNKETECLQSIDNNSPSFDEGPSESDSGVVTSVEAVKTCEINKTLNQINEPETLEINITDEDRNID